MLKRSKLNNHNNLNKQTLATSNVSISPRYQNESQKKKRKIFSEMEKVDSIINNKEQDKFNKKHIIQTKKLTNINKYHKIEKTSECKEKSKNKSNKSNKNNKKFINSKGKNIQTSINLKEKNIITNCITWRKSSLPKQLSFVSKISNDNNYPSTIDNEYNNYRNNKNKRDSEKKGGSFGKNKNNHKKKNNLYNKNNNIYDYQINQLKKKIIKQQTIDNNTSSKKFKNERSNNKFIKKKNSNNISSKNYSTNKNCRSFSPIQKNSNLYKFCPQRKNNNFSNTNPNQNYETSKSNNKSQKSLNINNKNIEDIKTISNNTFKNKKKFESCPKFNKNYNSIKNIKHPFIIEDNLTKNSSSGNIILRNNRRSYLDSNRGEMKQFYSLVNVNAPKNNKIQNEEKKN